MVTKLSKWLQFATPVYMDKKIGECFICQSLKKGAQPWIPSNEYYILRCISILFIAKFLKKIGNENGKNTKKSFYAICFFFYTSIHKNWKSWNGIDNCILAYCFIQYMFPGTIYDGLQVNWNCTPLLSETVHTQKGMVH